MKMLDKVGTGLFIVNWLIVLLSVILGLLQHGFAVIGYIVPLVWLALALKLDLFAGKYWIFRRWQNVVVDNLMTLLVLASYGVTVFTYPMVMVMGWFGFDWNNAGSADWVIFLVMNVMTVLINGVNYKAVYRRRDTKFDIVLGVLFGLVAINAALNGGGYVSRMGVLTYSGVPEVISNSGIFGVLTAALAFAGTAEANGVRVSKLFNTENRLSLRAVSVVVIGLLLALFANILGSVGNFGVSLQTILGGLRPGFLEELTTRGVLVIIGITAISAYTKSTKTVLIVTMWMSSIIFAAMHLVNALGGQNIIYTVVQVLFAVAFGLMAFVILMSTRNMWWTIIIHGGWDFLNFAFSGGSTATITAAPSVFEVVMGVVTSVAFLFVARYLYVQYHNQMFEYIEELRNQKLIM
jgi:membrane protease YdiL (CAAX protease family)